MRLVPTEIRPPSPAPLQFCADVEPGHSRALDCLATHREEPDFSADCRGLIESALAERAVDFRLDPTLRRACARDIERTCGRAPISAYPYCCPVLHVPRDLYANAAFRAMVTVFGCTGCCFTWLQETFITRAMKSSAKLL